MSIKNIDNIDYKGRQQNFKRDAFETIGEMKDFNENFLPDMFEVFCYETQKKYRFTRTNTLDPVLGKWREVIDGNRVIPNATKTESGVIKVGKGLSVDKDGILSTDEPVISPAQGNALTLKKDGLFVEVPTTENFVKKEWGKGLSSNDLTDELKDKILKSEENVQSDWNQLDKSKDSFINNKPTKLSDFYNDRDFITSVTKDLVNYYQKSQVYTKAEIQSLINIVNQISIKKVDKLPTENIDPRVFYLVPKAGTENDMYDEYMYIEGKWELFGVSSISFQNYYTKEQCDTLIEETITRMIEGKVDKEEGRGLSDENFSSTEKEKLAGLENYDDTKVKEDIENLQYSTSSIADTAGQAMLNSESALNTVAEMESTVETLQTDVSEKNDKIIFTDYSNDTQHPIVDDTNYITFDNQDNPNRMYKRTASQLWNFIKGKADTQYNSKITLNSDTNDIGDDTTFVLGGNQTPNPTSFVRRTGAKVWNYIKGKLFAHSGTAIDANTNLKPFSSGYYNNAPKTYSVDNQGCGTMLNVGYSSFGDSNTWNNQLFFPAADVTNGTNQKNMFWYRSRHNSTGYNDWQPIGSRGVKSQYSGGISVTGGIKVQLPGWDNVMFTMWIDVYDYSNPAQNAANQRSMSIYIGGYAYESKYFCATHCSVIGGTGFGGDAHVNIYMGQITNGGAPVIQIGSDGTVWTYPTVTVRDVTIRHATNINIINKWIGYDYPITQPTATLYNYHTVHTSTSTDVYRAKAANSATTASSCSGNSATATSATSNADGNRLGGSFDGGVTIVSSLLTTCSTKNGMSSGSFYNSAASGDLPAGWTNFLYIPHRIGTDTSENAYYGTMFLTQMTTNTALFCIAHRINGTNYEPQKI